MIGDTFINLSWWKKKKPEPQRVQTKCGEFIRNGFEWSGEVEAGGRLVKIAISDVENQPDPAFLMRLPALLTRLDAIEATSRSYMEGLLNDEYVLDEVCEGIQAEEFSLEFMYTGEEEFVYITSPDSEEAIGEHVSVRFKADKIVEYSTEFIH